MYLKRIELHGFKSFADKVNLEFQQGITGIVGPNGCGKSNITDAIRWVLGEQSVKSLRGSSMSDVIFAGSQDRKPQNVAEVTLVFDNSDHHLKSDYEEVEITRRIYRHNNEGEYLLNKQPCRLKDIVDLIMDTGLGRDSLSMISQGNISSFADSKPEDRRLMFEEAAGVAKYKKRKNESLRRLEKTTDNLNRIQDIVAELEKQIGPLKKQSDKATKYLELRKELEKIEISLIINEVNELKENFDTLKQSISELEQFDQQYLADLSSKEAVIESKKNKMLLLDKEINELQEKLMYAMEEVNVLNANKVQIDEKRKHIVESQSNEDIENKLISLKQMLTDVLNEYNNRVERYEILEKDVSLTEKKRQDTQMKIDQLRGLIEQQSSKYNGLRAKKTMLKEQLEDRSHYNYGVKTILSTNLNGIIGIVEQMIVPKENYELAISTALGSAMQFVLTKDQSSARNAISYLKQNRAGRATFLPIDSLSKRTVRDEHLLVAQNTIGFLGIASDFVEYNPRYQLVVSNQLGNTLITDTIETANHLANALYYRYKIVTLTGDVVNVGGSMSGGQSRKYQTPQTSKKELEKIEVDINQHEKNILVLKGQLNELETSFKEYGNILLQKKISYARIEEEVSQKLNEFNSLKTQFESLSSEKLEMAQILEGQVDSDIINQLNEAIKKRDELTEQIKIKREIRMSYVNDNDVLENEVRELRKLTSDVKNRLMNTRIEFTKVEASLNSKLSYLTEEYKMTFEYAVENYSNVKVTDDARSVVFTLKSEINRLGNINLDAINEYQEVSERYEHLNTQRLDLIEAQNSLLKAIDEMDEVMVQKFDETFHEINHQFNEVFRALLGGGKAMLKYTDPDNILETGVDIDVQPPGKSVQNISLFSGGEKALIAISCLFAILKVRPVPMCILDEVEAALDQANVERFAKYLKEFEEQTQFIVVTHRPGTMEQCDILYGATMQQKGVTKLISVKFEDVASKEEN
ncbi:MAG: chromosome segregation protein SMC [Beduini sp.]